MRADRVDERSASPTAATISWPPSVSNRTRPSRNSTESSAITIRTAPPPAPRCPNPAGLSIHSSPPTEATRSRSDVSPKPSVAPPTPSSRTQARTIPPLSASVRRDLLGVAVLVHVGQRLRDHEVDGRRDQVGHVDVGDVELHRDRAVPDEVAQRGGQAVVQPRRADPVREPAQLDDRRLQCVDGVVEFRCTGRARRGAAAPTAAASRRRGSAAGPRRAGRAPAGGAPGRGLGQPRPAGPHVVERLAQLQPQPADLDRQPGLDRQLAGAAHPARPTPSASTSTPTSASPVRSATAAPSGRASPAPRRCRRTPPGARVGAAAAAGRGRRGRRAAGPRRPRARPSRPHRGHELPHPDQHDVPVAVDEPADQPHQHPVQRQQAQRGDEGGAGRADGGVRDRALDRGRRRPRRRSRPRPTVVRNHASPSAQQPVDVEQVVAQDRDGHRRGHQRPAARPGSR